jgi:hypothetical protein
VSAEVAFDAGDHAVFVVRQAFVQQDMTRSFIPAPPAGPRDPQPPMNG